MYPLEAGEQTLWSGRPQRPQRWFAEHVMMGVSGGLLLLVLVLAEFRNIRPSTVGIYSLVVVAATGVWLPRLRSRRALAQATTYLLTDRRIVFVAQWPNGAEFRWVWLSTLQRPVVRELEQGLGTITFGTGRWLKWNLGATGLSGAWVAFTPELRAIPDAQQVASALEHAQNRLGERRFNAS